MWALIAALDPNSSIVPAGLASAPDIADPLDT
jgi:hypothetical protein